MRKIRELLRLKYELGRSHREIAASLGDRQQHGERLRGAGKRGGPVVAVAGGAGRRRAGGGAVPGPATVAGSPAGEPDWGRVHRELQRHKGVTLQLLWLEYREVHPNGYQYSWFCERYKAWRGLT